MQTGTKEFYEIQNQFEKDIKSINCIYGITFERYTKDEMKKYPGQFYKNGETNKFFHVYLIGFAFGKWKYN